MDDEMDFDELPPAPAPEDDYEIVSETTSYMPTEPEDEVAATPAPVAVTAYTAMPEPDEDNALTY